MNYLITGVFEHLKSEYIAKLKKSVLTPGSEKFNFEIFFAGETEAEKILNSLSTVPFLSDKRLIIIRNAEKLRAREKELILKYLKFPAPTTILVLESASAKPGKFLDEIKKLVKEVRFDRPKTGEVVSWIRRRFSGKHIEISREDAYFLAEAACGDLILLENEIDKITAFAGTGRKITHEHLESISSFRARKTVFNLADSVMNGNAREALAITRRLLLDEKPHQVLTLLAWHFRNFLKVKKRPAGRSIDETSRVLRINRISLQKMIEREKHFSQSDIEKKLEIILDADVSMKTGRTEAHHALESALIRLCGAF